MMHAYLLELVLCKGQRYLVVFRYYEIQYFQGSLCTPVGIDCYRNLTNMKSNCLKGCNGLFAVLRGKYSLENDDFENILSNYESYKRGFHDKIIYPLHLNGE